MTAMFLRLKNIVSSLVPIEILVIMLIYIYIYVYLEPICPLFLVQKNVFSNQNKGHLGSRRIYIFFFILPMKSKSTKLCPLVVRNPCSMDHPKDQP